MSTIIKNFTKLESKVLEIISWGDDFDEAPTESFAGIMDQFNGTEPQLKGILTSLQKKSSIWLGEYPNGMTSFHLNVSPHLFLNNIIVEDEIFYNIFDVSFQGQYDVKMRLEIILENVFTVQKAREILSEKGIYASSIQRLSKTRFKK